MHDDTAQPSCSTSDDSNRTAEENLMNNNPSLSQLLPPPFVDDESDRDIYGFETDHVALKSNKDYRKLLSSLITYEAQRAQAIADMNTLMRIQEDALKDPIAFVEKLQNNVDLEIPKAINIAPLVSVPWDQYTSVPEHLIGSRRQSLRIGLKLDTTMSENGSLNESNINDSDSTTSETIVIRGRVKDDSKNSTFNQLWTVDEQKRLEELLVKFPPEEVEARRWEKIAGALGNRSTAQVASRIQKYFIKLTKAGLPVPGRIPKLRDNSKQKPNHRHQKFNRFYLQPSTMLQSHQPPVYMSDDDLDADIGQQCFRPGSSSQDDISDEEDIPLELQNTEAFRELMRLKRIRTERLRDDLGGDDAAEHLGYKCDRCEMNPIRGTRWNCRDCPGEISVDLCSICVDSPFETAEHNSSHRLDPVRNPPSQSYIDMDYMKFAPAGYNYLDPNYMPAT